MSSTNETDADATTTYSNNFTLAYNEQVRGSSPLASTDRDGARTASLAKQFCQLVEPNV
ncbi:MAG: hypothetical protein ACYDHP_10355 [Ferrimicrobium sp.]